MKPEQWQQIERICNSALDLPAGEREAFVKKECAGDDSLRKEVDRLLARQQQAERFIAVPALEMAAQELASGGGPGPGWNALPFDLLHYRVIEKIGEGGMGVVYRATDTRLNRQVAIKALPEIFAADPERLARFEREARATALLLYPIGGGEPRSKLQGLMPGDFLIRWHADGKRLFIWRDAGDGVTVFLVDPYSGKRGPWRQVTLTAAFTAGLTFFGPLRLSADGECYAYFVAHILSELYVVNGVH